MSGKSSKERLKLARGIGIGREPAVDSYGSSMGAGEAGGVSTESEGRNDVLMGEVEVNFRKEDEDDTGVGGPCFLIRLARCSRALLCSLAWERREGGDAVFRRWWSANEMSDQQVFIFGKDKSNVAERSIRQIRNRCLHYGTPLRGIRS